MRPRPFERFHVIAEPTFIAYLQDVSAAYVSQYVAPVVVVLNEIALSKPDPISNALSGDGDTWDSEVAGLAEKALDAILSEDRFVECCRAEIVCPIHLKRTLHGVLCGRKLRDHVWIVLMGQCAEEASVNAVPREVFIDADEILIAVAVTGRIENAGVDHRRRAGQETRGRRSARSREDIVCRLRDSTDRRSGWRIRVQDLRAKRIW